MPASGEGRAPRVLQGHESTTAASVGDESLRAVVIDLIKTDPEIRALLAESARPDAASGEWVLALVKENLRQYVRPDALRRPV